MTRTPLPDADHILRHVKPTAFDNGRVQGAAFGWMPKQPDDGLSVNWIEHADGATQDEKIQFIRTRRRRDHDSFVSQWSMSPRVSI